MLRSVLTLTHPEYTNRTNDRREFWSSGIRSLNWRRPEPENHLTPKIICTGCLWFKNFHRISDKDVHLRERIPCSLFCIQRVRAKFLGCAETGLYPNWQQSRHPIFQLKIVPPAPWNACDDVIQLNFAIAQNMAADYLSRLEADPKDKLVMKISEGVQTVPIEINVHSAGVS